MENETEFTWEDILNEHWRQFKLACQSMNRYDKMVELNWREYVLYDLCKRHNQEIGKEYFKFTEEPSHARL
jgi:hypothetical protein